MGVVNITMMRDVEYLIQYLCIIGGGGAERYATIFGLSQVQYQQCCYDLAHGIAATAGTILEVVTDISPQ